MLWRRRPSWNRSWRVTRSLWLEIFIGEVDSSGPLVLVVGSEGDGLSRLVREACDSLASIPIAAQVESLNAGVAAGIALYEINRRR